MDSFLLTNKVAIITGGNTGIGQSFAVAYAKAGAHLVLVTHGTNREETNSLLKEENASVTFIQADLTKADDREKVIQTTLNKYGRIDILVNNAGTIRRAPLLEYKEEDWNDVLDINLNAVYCLSHECAKIMVKQKAGKIINIASMLSFQGGKFVPAYTASKHAVAGLTKAFANELACENIQCNAIAPGYVITKNTEAIRSNEKRYHEILDRIPAGRWAYPADLMGTAVFLASDASNYINGQIIAVDGGWLVR